MSQNLINQYEFSVLREVVSDEDLFDDKTHENVSSTIYRLINDTNEGITVGLEGQWGAGKSTVINLLRDKFKEDHTLFFLFDAWAHDGDPLRRIFIESIIREIDPKGDDETLVKYLEEITGRKKTVKIATTKTASVFGKLLSISAFLIAPGAALMSVGARVYGLAFTPFDPQTEINIPFLFGFIFSFAPVWLLILWAIFRKNEEGVEKWAFFESKGTESYTQDITEDGERTSIEFQDYFSKVMKHILEDKKSYRKVIIVIDNLDRVGDDHAKGIWSTLQTFFQSRSTTVSYGWNEKIWFLVPFDRTGFASLWSDGSDDKHNKDREESFLNKCFQIIMEIPTPVMSGWAKYLFSSAKKSLVGWPESEIRESVLTYRLYFSRLEESPTPRKIHSFINQVGVLGYRWGGVMSPSSIALYAILRQQYGEQELRKHILFDTIPNIGVISNADNDVKMELAGMLFGVKKEKGIELLLTPEIKSSIFDGDGEKIVDLEATHNEAFWIAWNANKKDLLPTDSHTDEYLINSLKALAPIFLKYTDAMKKDIQSIYELWVLNDYSFNHSKYNYEESVSLLQSFAVDKDRFLLWLNAKITKDLAEAIKEIPDSETNETEIINIERIISFLRKNGKPIQRKLYQILDFENWPTWLTFIEVNKLEIPEVLPAKQCVGNIWNTASADPNNFSLDFIEILIATFNTTKNPSEWAPVAEGLSTWAARNAPKGSQHEMLFELATKLIGSSIDTTNLESHLEKSEFWQGISIEDISECSYIIILPAIVFKEKLLTTDFIPSVICDFWSNKNVSEQAQRLYLKLDQSGNGCTLWLLATDKDNLLAINMIQTCADVSLYSCISSITRLDELSWASNQELQEIVLKSISTGALNDTTKSIIKKDLDLYSDVIRILNESKNNLATNFVHDCIKNALLEDWSVSLKKNSSLLNCLEEANQNFTSAFEVYAKNTINELNDEAQFSQLENIADYIQDRSLVFKRISKIYFDTEDDNLSTEDFFSLSGYIEKFIDETDEEKLMFRIQKWIDSNSIDRIKWLVENKRKPFNTVVLEGLKSRVIDSSDEEESDSQELWETLKELLGITLD